MAIVQEAEPHSSVFRRSRMMLLLHDGTVRMTEMEVFLKWITRRTKFEGALIRV